MRIMCMEQGDWMNPGEYPSTRRDWEVLQGRDYSISPNFRHRAADYPINDIDSP